jgi:16S rRNA (cytidine1402-2'-O)-methyltransferase
MNTDIMFIKSTSKKKEIKKGLYLVSTPIGNLSDITLRAIDILKNSEYILCEDTRVSKKLFENYQIKSKLISNHKFNERKNLTKVINLLKSGLVVSLVSDAGTPSISDPGSILIKECSKNDIKIIPIPGPSAVTAAVSISGFNEKFFFYGFFPEKLKTINQDLNFLSKINSSIVFFISPNKFNRIIPFLKKSFGDREILICREMTKLFEEFTRTEVNLLKEYENKLKGELTIVISEPKKDKSTSQHLDESDKKIIKEMINKLSIKEITNLINTKNKVQKKEIYNYCLKLKNES